MSLISLDGFLAMKVLGNIISVYIFASNETLSCIRYLRSDFVPKNLSILVMGVSEKEFVVGLFPLESKAFSSREAFFCKNLFFMNICKKNIKIINHEIKNEK